MITPPEAPSKVSLRHAWSNQTQTFPPASTQGRLNMNSSTHSTHSTSPASPSVPASTQAAANVQPSPLESFMRNLVQESCFSLTQTQAQSGDAQQSSSCTSSSRSEGINPANRSAIASTPSNHKRERTFRISMTSSSSSLMSASSTMSNSSAVSFEATTTIVDKGLAPVADIMDTSSSLSSSSSPSAPSASASTSASTTIHGLVAQTLEDVEATLAGSADPNTVHMQEEMAGTAAASAAAGSSILRQEIILIPDNAKPQRRRSQPRRRSSSSRRGSNGHVDPMDTSATPAPRYPNSLIHMQMQAQLYETVPSYHQRQPLQLQQDAAQQGVAVGPDGQAPRSILKKVSAYEQAEVPAPSCDWPGSFHAGPTSQDMCMCRGMMNRNGGGGAGEDMFAINTTSYKPKQHRESRWEGMDKAKVADPGTGLTRPCRQVSAEWLTSLAEIRRSQSKGGSRPRESTSSPADQEGGRQNATFPVAGTPISMGSSKTMPAKRTTQSSNVVAKWMQSKQQHPEPPQAPSQESPFSPHVKSHKTHKSTSARGNPSSLFSSIGSQLRRDCPVVPEDWSGSAEFNQYAADHAASFLPDMSHLHGTC